MRIQSCLNIDEKRCTVAFRSLDTNKGDSNKYLTGVFMCSNDTIAFTVEIMLVTYEKLLLNITPEIQPSSLLDDSCHRFS